MTGSLNSEILAICNRLNEANKKNIRRVMEEACHLMGWDYYGFVTHIISSFTHTRALASTNYPIPWLAIYKLKNYYSIDPIISHCFNNNLPITWTSRDEDWADCDEKTRRFMKDCRKNGWTCGVGIPVHTHHNHGLLHLTTKEPFEKMGAAIDNAFLYGYVLGIHLFEALSRNHLENRVRLSNREHQILQYVADGYNSKMIAKKLGIALPTVTYHITNAQRKVGAKTRQELVTKAYSTGLLHINLHWSDHAVLNWPDIDKKIESIQDLSNNERLN